METSAPDGDAAIINMGPRWYEVLSLVASMSVTCVTTWVMLIGIGLSAMGLDSCAGSSRCGGWVSDHAVDWAKVGLCLSVGMVLMVFVFAASGRRRSARWCAVLAPLMPLVVLGVFTAAFPG